ncbi:hypothetical protein ACQCTC_17050, partial [Ralstonia pseudosolanacearum]
ATASAFFGVTPDLLTMAKGINNAAVAVMAVLEAALAAAETGAAAVPDLTDSERADWAATAPAG